MKHYMPKANQLILKVTKYFPNMQLVCFELFSSVQRTFGMFFRFYHKFSVAQDLPRLASFFKVFLLAFQG